MNHDNKVNNINLWAMGLLWLSDYLKATKVVFCRFRVNIKVSVCHYKDYKMMSRCLESNGSQLPKLWLRKLCPYLSMSSCYVGNGTMFSFVSKEWSSWAKEDRHCIGKLLVFRAWILPASLAWYPSEYNVASGPIS